MKRLNHQEGVVATFVIALLLAVACDANSGQRTLCIVATDPVQALYLMQAANEINPALHKHILPIGLSPSITDLTREFRDNNCTMVAGPGLKDLSLKSLYEDNIPSTVSTAVQVIATAPIIDYGSIHGELENTKEHKWYNRMVMADTSSLISTICNKFGWESIALIEMGGGVNIKFEATSKVHATRTIRTPDTTYLTELDVFFQQIKDDYTFIPIFVVVPNEWRKALTIAGLHRRYETHRHKAMIFIQYTNDCAPSPVGSFCAYFEPARPDKLASVFKTIPQVVRDEFSKTYPLIDANATLGTAPDFAETYKALAYDVVLHTNDIWQSVSGDQTTAEVQELLRKVRTDDGLTGPIEFTNDGERRSAQVGLVNWHTLKAYQRTATYIQNSSNKTVTIDDNLFFGDRGETLETPRIVWPGGRVGGDPPTPVSPTDAISTEILLLFASATIVAGVLAIWALTRIIHRFLEAKVVLQENRLQSCSTGYFMFANITHYRALRRKFPLKTQWLVEQFVLIAESLANKHNVCIVKFVEDHLMLIASQHAVSILRFAVELQSDLHTFDWIARCPNLNHFYERQEDQAIASGNHGPAATKKSSHSKMFNGLRVRMGISCGPFHEGRDAAGKVDYLGDSVNVSSRVSASSAGGQILCSGRVLQSIPPVMIAQFAGGVDNLGHFQLSGLRIPVEIYQIAARDILQRQFVTLGEQNDAKVVVMDTNDENADYFHEESLVSAVFE